MNNNDLNKKFVNSVGIVVLNWNDPIRTLRCISELKKIEHNLYDIIIVDNGSDKEKLKELKSIITNYLIKNNLSNIIEENYKKKIYHKKIGIKKIILLKNKKNQGISRGLNKGYKYCIKNNYKYILRVDNDIITTKYFLKKIIYSFDTNINAVAISPKINYSYQKNKSWFIGAKIDWKYLAFIRLLAKDYKRKIIDTFTGIVNSDLIAGACSIYKTSALKKVGICDTDFFIGPEDIELSYRLKKIGKILVNLNAKVYHSVSSSKEYTGSLLRFYYEQKAFLILVKKISKYFIFILAINTFFIRTIFYLINSYKKNYKLKGIISLFVIFDFLSGKYGKYDINILNKNYLLKKFVINKS
jgi:GT2 family glycosyltransferase